MTSDNMDFAAKLAAALNAAELTQTQAVVTLAPNYEPSADGDLKIFVVPVKRNLKRLTRDSFQQKYVAQIGLHCRVTSVDDPAIDSLTKLSEDVERTLANVSTTLNSGLVCEVDDVDTSAIYDTRNLCDANVWTCVITVVASTSFCLT